MVSVADNIAIAIAGVALYAQNDDLDAVNACYLYFQQTLPKYSPSDLTHTTDITAMNSWASYFVEYDVSSAYQSKFHSEISAVYDLWASAIPNECEFLEGLATGASIFKTYWSNKGYTDFPTVTCA